VLELVGLTKRYGDVLALDDVGFSVAGGEVLGFVGPNGAGKSTAMRLVLGVLAADSGEVRWRDRPLDQTSRRRIGYMPEERGLYPKMRARAQLAYLAQLHGLAADAADAAARRWLDRLGLAERMDEPVEKLSLGNQQRVQLGAALVHDPEVLVLDEPFSGLDPVGVDVMADVLRERAAAGVAIVFSSHQLELVEQLCDRVAIIRDGRLVALGTVRELREGRTGRRFRIGLEDAEPEWGRRLVDATGVELLDQRPEAGLFALDGVDEQRLLDEARRLGRVVHFARETPSLAELFRSVITAEPSTAVAPAADREPAGTRGQRS
jgi:ABC-2 type transport system ATP-binding protein